jgi:hypothetical protein
MARWKLTEAHYIVAERDGVRPEWEYKEISRATGREIRKKFPVPMYLDPKSQEDWNHRPDAQDDGMIVVTDGVNAHHKDIVLIKNAKGQLPITPGMEPLDDEARAISAKYNERVIPIEGREDATYSERLLDKFIEQMAEAKTNAGQQLSTPGIDKVLESMTAMMEQNQKILTALVEQKAPERATGRR